ncbi:MAG: T9SS C-terminal target domain-containing protein [Bacteroidetes bacterium]|nr:MAG: T9SS C-terminal target domain-containing protein [Bacteroidota bacterium]
MTFLKEKIMFKKAILIFILAFTGAGFSFGQALYEPCGTTYDMQVEILERTRANKDILRTNPIMERSTVWVPLRFHLVAKNDGTGAVSEQKVYDQVCELNETYAVMDLQFYLKDFNYINNTTMYSDHEGTSFLMQSNRDNAAINIFVVQDAGGIPGQSETLGYFSPNFDWLVMRIDEIGRFKKTLSHEVGHFFSLAHPFLGWEVPNHFDPDDFPTNQVGVNSPQNTPNELQDGSNCDQAADLVCDTPPDYNFGFLWNTCNYTGGAMDPTGTVVDPMEVNIMSYFLDCEPADYTFTQDQSDLIITDLNTQARAYIRPNYTPTHAELTGIPDIISPAYDEAIPAYNVVQLEWTQVEGATHYFIEISRLSSFSTNFWRHKESVYGTSKTLYIDMEPDKNYYWRVRAVNEARTCATFSENGKFRTGTAVAVDQLTQVNDFKILPNPVSSNEDLQFRLNVSEGFEGQISLIDITGKVVRQLPQQFFAEGQNIYTLALNGEAPGVYFVNINSQKGKITRKVVITQ